MADFSSDKTQNVRVTVLEDPNNSLQELFNPSSQRQQVPLHQRNLPKSFFVPPAAFKEQNHISGLPSTDLVVSHSKANSSPACLDAPLYANIESGLSTHSHQKSLDVGAELTPSFCHNINLGDIVNRGFIHNTRESQSSPYACRPVLNYAVSELPVWYEMTLNENNQVYFLNHKTKVTTWFDPRIPEEHQKWGMSLDELQQVHINYARQLYAGIHGPDIFRIPVESVTCSSTSGPAHEAITPTAIRNQHSPNAPNLTPVFSQPISSMNARGAVPATANVGTTILRSKLSGNSPNTATVSSYSHPPKVPNAKLEHAVANNVSHQRQQSHGNTVAAQQENINLLGTHLRSCSQPVSMTVNRDSKGPSHYPKTVEASRADVIAHLSLFNGSSVAGGLSASPSLIGLSVNSGQLISQHIPLQSAHLGCTTTTTSSSSGQLVQGLECLRLNTCTSPATNATSSPRTLEQQQVQISQFQQQYVIPIHTMSQPLQGTPGLRYIGTALQTATPHSHQGSMDSGVGPSLTGQSSASANQTPDHTVMLLCDPSMNGNGSETMEGISYPNEELTCASLNMFDNIDISDISA